VTRIVAAALLLWVLAAACGGDEPEHAARTTPTPLTTAPSAGDLLIYSHQVREESGASRVFPVLEVVTFDLSTKRPLSAFDVGGANAYPLQIVLAGDRIVANLEQRIVSYALDGSDERTIAEATGGGNFIGIGASRDGTMLAYTELTSAQMFPYEDNTAVFAITLDDGREILRLRQSDTRFEGYVGQLALITWRDDDRGFAVSGYTYSEAPGGLATVLLDGTVRVHDISGYAFLSPNGRLIGDDSAEWCDLGSPPENHDLRIVDLDTGEALAEAHDDALTLQSREWSPDGTELLFERYRLTGVAGAECPQRAGDSEWLILRARGDAPEPVADPYAARDRWYEHPLTYTCDGERQVDPYCAGENGVVAPVAVSVDGSPVAEVLEFRLIGFTGTP
jgi:hypothetical protein